MQKYYELYQNLKNSAEIDKILQNFDFYNHSHHLIKISEFKEISRFLKIVHNSYKI